MRVHQDIHITRDLLTRAALFAGCMLMVGQIAIAQTPTAPSDVRLRIVRDNAIDIFWQDNSNNESAFDVFRRSGGGASTLLGAVDANITFFLDRNSNIRPNVEFCYRVAARNTSGSSSSPEVCITVPPRPDPPTNLQVSRQGATSPIGLSWADNSDNETDFLVYRDTDGAAFVLYDTVDANVTTFSDFLLRTTGTYCYFVSAINPSGESVGTDPACIDVGVSPPVPPVALDAETISSSEIEVTWLFGVISHTTLFLERSDDGQASWTDVFQSSNLILDFTDSGLNANTEYCYRVRVENASNVPSFSPVSCAGTSFTVPDTPEGVTVEGLENRSILVGWEPVVSAQILYRVERLTGSLSFEIVADSLDVTSFTDVGLDAASVHCYRVRAFNPQFFSDWSEIVCGIVSPDVVTALEAVPDPADPMRQIVATWQPGVGVTASSYEVMYREAGEGSYSDPITVTEIQVQIVGLDDAVEYEVAVRAVRTINDLRSESSVVTTTVRTNLSFWPGDVNGDGTVSADDVVVLTAPSCFGAATAFATNGRNVAWSEIPVELDGQDATTVRCDTDRSGRVELFDFLAIAANIGKTTGKSRPIAPAVVTNDAHLDRLVSIYDSFEPEAGNVEQERLKKELAEIIGKHASDIPEVLSLESTYPNPARGEMHAVVDVPAASRISIVLINSAGQTVRKLTDETLAAGRRTLSFDVSGLAPGLYFVVLESDAKRLTRPVTVIR